MLTAPPAPSDSRPPDGGLLEMNEDTRCSLCAEREWTWKISHAVIGLCLGVAYLVFLSGCNGGLSPVQSSSNVQPGFGGTVRFVSPWPPADSVQDFRVVAFFNYPPSNIIAEVSSGQAKVYPAIGSSGPAKFVDSLSYAFYLDSSATFHYVAVALQYGPNVLQDWKVVGAYGYSHGVGRPDSVVVKAGEFVNGINIDVDFKNTPPNPLSSIASPVHRK